MNSIDNLVIVYYFQMGTIAGNLMMKHAHRDFPSDIFVVFTGIDARINIMATKDNVLSLTCEDFLDFPMEECLIVSITIPSYFAEDIFFNSYKVFVFFSSL